MDINPITGNKKRKATFETAQNKRSMALDAHDRMLIRRAEKGIEELTEALIFSLFYTVFCLAALYHELFEEDFIILILQALVHLARGITDHIGSLITYISTMIDIEPHEEIPRGVSYGPRVHCSIDDFRSDDDSRMKTNFTPAELRLLIQFFQLNQAADPVDGYIRIEGYIFKPEEIMIFVLRKLKNGASNSSLCGDVFGGDPRKWSHVMKWFYSRADQMIINHVSLYMIERYRDDLPYFAEKIAIFLRKGFQIENEDGTFQHVPGIDYSDPADPFRIFGFLDCSNFRSSTPATGPSGIYEGATRNPNSDLIQRAYYNGWKKIHGIKILSILLPNGLSLMHGPISVRRNDIDHAHISGMNEYLLNLQENQQSKYCVYGDGIFRDLVAFDSVFRSYNRPAPGAPLTEFENHENIVFKKLRVSIEHSYGAVENSFDVTKIKREWKMMNTSSFNPAKMRLLFFLYNCYTCIHGNSASKRFDCDPPSSEQFLFQ